MNKNVKSICKHCLSEFSYIRKRKKERKFCCKKCITDFFKLTENKKITNDKINKTFLEKYGCLPNENLKKSLKEKTGFEHSLQNKESLKKQRKTMIDRYGKEHALQVEGLYDKKEKTCKDVYGSDFYKKFGELAVKSMIEKHGVKSASQLPDWKEKTSKTNMINYGVPWATQSDEIKQKIIDGCKEKLGVEHCSYNKETIEKRKQTNLNRYGVTNKLMLYKYNNISKFQLSVYEKVKIKKPEALLEVYNKETRFSFDILVPSEKLIIDCHGDYWHCNPLKYKPDYYNKRKALCAKEIWNIDKKRKIKLESIGYKIIIVWEHDWNIESNIDNYV